MTERMIFEAALERVDPAERAAYLEQACAGDVGLCRRVEELLEAHFAPGTFLEAPAMINHEAPRSYGPGQSETDQLDSAGVVDLEGSRIGPYKLLQKIGEGGMGVVYMAEQEKPVRRKVAFKIIKPGMDSRQVVARFEAERQALALMDHSNIAKVLDGGTTGSGLPYFVMDLVKGIPVTQYCDEAKLSPRERLELFVPICQAIQHAHQKGIVHRDIKPSNVLVTLIDAKPVPKVIDFGVAKAIDQRLTERTLFTQFGAIIGTPEYMSPEQADLSGLDVDTRSDIYSLGVLLYELLTGSTPLERQRLREAGYAEIVRRIKEEEPDKPSTRISQSGDRLAAIAATRRTEPARLARLVRGELDWIVMRALEKERTRRYKTTDTFGRDIDRYLVGDPVEAGPPSAAYRLRTYARKHRVALATAAAFLALLVVASVVSVSLAIGFRRAELAATAQRNRAAVAEAAAVRDLDRALAAERDSKAAAERAATEAAISRAVNEFLQRDLLGQADVFNQAGPGLKPDPEIRVRALLDRASASLDGKFGDQPAVEVAIRRTIGETYKSLGLYESAQIQIERALKSARRRLGDNHADTLKSIASLAVLRLNQGKYGAAERLLTDALDRLRHADAEERPEAIRIMVLCAAALTEEGNFSNAQPLLTRAVALSRTVFGRGHEVTLGATAELARLQGWMGRFAESERYAAEALEIARHERGEEDFHTLTFEVGLAMAYQQQGNYAGADELSSRALERATRLLGLEHPMTATLSMTRGSILAMMGKTGDAKLLLSNAIASFRRTVGEDHDYACHAKAVLAETHQAEGRLDAAESMFAQAIAGWRRTLGTEYGGSLLGMNPLAELHIAEGHADKAEPVLVEARRVGARQGDQGWFIADTSSALARLRLMQREFIDAEAAARRALAIRLDRHPDHWTRFDGMSLLGGALAGQKKFAEAEPLLIQGYEGLKERRERIPFLWRTKRPAQAGARVVELYEAWGKKDKADEWRKKKVAAAGSIKAAGPSPSHE
jgi:serine/threonine protein kinase